MKKGILCAILTMLFVISQSVNAQDDFISDGDIKVQQAGDFITIIAKGIGQGLTLESAKIEAMNSFMPKLVIKTKNLPGSVCNVITRSNETTGYNETKGEGASQIEGKIFVEDYWKLEDGIYTYRIKFIISNMEEAEKPSE